MDTLRGAMVGASLVVGMAAADAGLAAQAAARAVVPARAQVRHLRKASLVDERIFGQQAEVLSIVIPSDWTFQGSFTVDLPSFRWCPENAFTSLLLAESPDKQVAYALYSPLQTMDFRNPILAEDARRRQAMGQGFCVQHPAVDLPTFVAEALVPRHHPGARVLRVEPAPQLQQGVRKQLAALQLPPNMRISGDAADVVIGYSVGGKPVEEHVFVVGGWRSEGAFGQPTADLVYSNYTPVFGLRVPVGQFARYQQQFADIIASSRLNAHYYAAVVEAVMAQRQAIFNNFIDEIRQTSAIWRKSWEASNNASKQAEAAKSKERAFDVAGAWSDTTLDVQDYKDSNGDTVQLSGGYNHVFSNGNGDYIQTNDPSYDPAVATGKAWQPITAIPR